MKKILSDEEFAALKNVLIADPLAGDVISGTYGLRKYRVAAKGKGKSGGARVIYYYFSDDSEVLLLMIFAKSETEDLTDAQYKALTKYVKEWR